MPEAFSFNRDFDFVRLDSLFQANVDWTSQFTTARLQ